MLWGQPIKVFTDHKNLTRDALGLTSDRVYRWRLLLEEYAPDIVYIKGVHNTVADAISRLEYNPALNPTNEYTHATVRVPTCEPSTDPSKWKAVEQNTGDATPNATPQQARRMFKWTPCLQIAVKRMTYTLSQQLRLPKPKRRTLPTKTSLSAMQSLIKDWKSGSLRTPCVSAKTVGWLYLSHSSGEQYYGTTIICSTLDTLVLRRR